MMIVSTRDFRSNQTKYLNMVKAGVNVVLRSREGSFKITPVTEVDTLVNKDEFASRLRNALQEVIDAKAGKSELKSAEALFREL